MPTNADLVYLDSSALVKLVADEPESSALKLHLSNEPVLASCALAKVEVLRAVRAQGAEAWAQAKGLLRTTRVLSLNDDLLEVAARVGPDVLRSLDAIHLAAALHLGNVVDELITYDRRMAEAASRLGLPTVTPT